MAVYRQVQITFWQDSFVLKLTPEEKFFYLYLLTNSKTKQCGIYELPLSIIQIETGYNRETVIKLIQRFIDHQKIAYDWEHEEVFLHNWIKHNPYEKNPKILKCIEKELKSVHNKNLIPLTSPLQGVLQKEKEEEQKEKKEYKQEEPKEVGNEEETDVHIRNLFIKRWSRNYKNLSEMQGAERLVLDYGYEKVDNAFRIAGERDKVSIPYVRGILSKEAKENEPKSRFGNSKIMNELYGGNNGN